MKNILTIITFIFVTSSSAQQIEKQVFSSIGNDATAVNFQITQTIGEVVVETYTSGSYILGQGFKQVEESETDTTVSSIKNLDIVLNYNFYPNPIKDIINVELVLNSNNNLEITLINYLGQAVDKKRITTKKDEIIEFQFDLRNQKNGIYFLKMCNKKYTFSKTVEIVKY